MRELLRTRYFTIVEEAPRGLVVVTRSPTPFASVDDVTSAWTSVADTLDRLGRRGRRVLVDLRLVVGRNDPAFEAAMAEVRPKVHADLAKLGLLVASVAGRLQISRHQREDGVPRLISTDETELRAYLLAPEPPPSKP